MKHGEDDMGNPQAIAVRSRVSLQIAKLAASADRPESVGLRSGTSETV